MLLPQQIPQLCRDYNLIAIYAFGSRAKEIAARCKGEQLQSVQPTSDVDVGVLPARDHALIAQDRVTLMLALEDLWLFWILPGKHVQIPTGLSP